MIWFSAVTKKQLLPTQRSEPTPSTSKTKERPADFFSECITIDDDDDDNDIQEIERQP